MAWFSIPSYEDDSWRLTFLLAPKTYAQLMSLENIKEWVGKITLPETNSSPLKINGWKMIHFLLVPRLFQGAFAVSFREGIEKIPQEFPIHFSIKFDSPKPGFMIPANGKMFFFRINRNHCQGIMLRVIAVIGAGLAKVPQRKNQGWIGTEIKCKSWTMKADCFFLYLLFANGLNDFW